MHKLTLSLVRFSNMNDLLSAFPLKEPESYISLNVLGFSIHGFRKLFGKEGGGRGTGGMIRTEKRVKAQCLTLFFLK